MEKIQMIEDIQTRIKKIKGTLTIEQQKLLHLRSIDNFLFHFYSIKNFDAQVSVKGLIDKYFEILDSEGYIIDKAGSNYLGKKYIRQIGFYYTAYLNFKLYMPLYFPIFLGLHLDFIILIFGFLKHVYYIPIITLSMLLYWLYLKLTYEKNKKVYAIGY